ncbi:hypothetical protein [Halochromatium sp.]
MAPDRAGGIDRHLKLQETMCPILMDDLLSDCSEGNASRFAADVIGRHMCHFLHLLERFDAHWNEFTAAKRPWRANSSKAGG